MLSLRGTRTKYCAVPACQHVFVWDLRKGEKMFDLTGDQHEVTALTQSPDNQHLAVGYSDGTVRIFDLITGQTKITFSGHKSSVTALNYDQHGMRLVSGSKDTIVIVWDIVNEAGMYRLKGHKGVITQARFISTKNILITSSKDTFVKFWDLDTQHCFYTLVGHRTEVWDFVVTEDENRLITGSSDSELRVWRLRYAEHQVASPVVSKKPRLDDRLSAKSDDDDESEEGEIVNCEKMGSIMRQGRERVVSMTTDPTGKLFCCHGNDVSLELFSLNTEEEAQKHLHKRQKRARKKARDALPSEEMKNVELSVTDYMRRITTIKMGGKIKSFACRIEDGSAKILCQLTNNILQSFAIDIDEKKASAMGINKLTLPGHRTDVRTICFSSDNTAILSASAEGAKIWNRATLQCIRTMPCDYALCCCFAPGDRHVVIGTKTGKLQLFDIAAGNLLETIDAHEGAVWSICLAPNQRSLTSGSADKSVKFWDLELISDEQYSTVSKRLTLVESRILKVPEDVLCVKYSPNHKLLAVALLDNTVKVFFADSLKFFLSMYGHKLPVLCMDISSDSTLLATGSADRNIKLWGLDFGDCHKSLFAHDDSIMCLQFIPKTHMFFTGGKDGKLKQWDGDSFQHILTLDGHLGEVWCLSVSPSGNFVATGSHDKSLRLWEKTEEPLILEEEREMEREKESEEALGQNEEPVIPGETNKETGLAGKQTVETIKAAEKLMEALDLYKNEMHKLEVHKENCKAAQKELPSPALHPMFQAFGVDSPQKYVLEVVQKIRSSELEECLIVMPFSYIPELLHLLNAFISDGQQVELMCRCLFFLLRIHQGQVTSNQLLLPIIAKLQLSTVKAVTSIRDTVGFNMAGLKLLQRHIEDQEKVKFFADATDQYETKRKRKKKRAILAIKT